MVNNELNPQGPSYTPEDLNRFLDESSQRQASYNSILRGAKAMGFDQDSVRKTMYNRSEQRREDQMQTYAEDLINLRLDKQRIASENERLKQIEALKKKEQNESGSAPDGAGLDSSLSQQIVDADSSFLNSWNRRQLLLDYEKAIDTPDNDFEISRLQKRIQQEFGVELGFEKGPEFTRGFEGAEDFSVPDIPDLQANSIVNQQVASSFNLVKNTLWGVPQGIIDTVVGLGSGALREGRVALFGAEDYDNNFQQSRAFLEREKAKNDETFAASIEQHNAINTQLGYAPNFEAGSLSEMESLYGEILSRDMSFNKYQEEFAQELGRELGRQALPGYNMTLTGIMDTFASPVLNWIGSGVDAMSEIATGDGEAKGLARLGSVGEDLQNWADRHGVRRAVRTQLAGVDPRDERGIVESFVDGDFSAGFKKTAVAAPDLIAQVGAILATKGKVRTAVFAGMGAQSAGSFYGEIKGREDLTAKEKWSLSTSVGAAEFLTERMFLAAENLFAKGVKVNRTPSLAIKEARENVNKALADIRKGKLNVGKEALKGFGSEGLEEGLMSVVEQNMEAWYDVAQGKSTYAQAMKDFNGYELADSFLLGGLMGAPVSTIGALASNLGHSAMYKQMDAARADLREAEQSYEKATDPVTKDLMRMAVLEAQDRMYNLHSVAEQMYGRFSVEDGDRVIALNQRLSKLRDDINGTKDRKTREQLKKEFKNLYEQKAEIESKYVTEQDIEGIEDKTPFSEQELRRQEEVAKENGGQYQMTFPDSTGKPATVEERALAAAEVRAQELLDLAEDKSSEQAEAQKAADKDLQTQDAPQTQEQEEPVQPKETRAPQTNSVTLEAGDQIEITAEDLIGTELASVTASNINGFLRGAAPALQKTGTKVVVHKTQESFDASNRSADQTLGYYDSSTNTIHLRPNSDLGVVREEFSHAILASIVGPTAPAAVRQRLFREAKEVLSEERVRKIDEEYRAFYTKQRVKPGAEPTPDDLAFIQAKVEEETIVDAMKNPPAGGGFRAFINRIISRLFGKEFVIKSDDALADIARKMQMASTHEKSTVDVEGATRPQTSESVSAALKMDPVAGKQIYIPVNLRENRFGDRSERAGSESVRAYRFNDYRHFSNWYAKITGNSNPDYVGRVGRMYYIDADGKKVIVNPPAPVLNRDGSKKYVAATESDRVRYARVKQENRVRRANKVREYKTMRTVLENVMRKYDIKGEFGEISEFGNTREGLVDARNTVMDILQRRGSKIDTNKLVSTLSSMDVTDGNVTFINTDGFKANPKGLGGPLLLTSNSTSMPVSELSADAIKAFADANVVEMEMADGVIGVVVDGDNAVLTMNHKVPEVYKERVLEFAKREGMPSVYSTMDGDAIPVSEGSTYKGMGRRDAVLDAVADLKQNKLPTRKYVKPAVSPAAGSVESLGTISPSLKSVEKAAKKMEGRSIPASRSDSLAQLKVKMGEAIIARSKRGLENKVSKGFRKDIKVADLTDPKFMKTLDGCEFITVAYDQTGQTTVTINGRPYDIRSGVRGAKDGEIMSHRSEKTRDLTADAIEKAALSAHARGKKVVILYTSMGEGGVKTNPFVGRMVLEESLQVAKDLGIEDAFYEAFSDVFNMTNFTSETFKRELRREIKRAGLGRMGQVAISSEQDFRKLLDMISKPRGTGSLSEREATFEDRGSVISSMMGDDLKFALLKRVGAEVSGQYQDKIIKSSDLKSIADPALTNANGGQGKLAPVASVVALQTFDPMIALETLEDGQVVVNDAWVDEAFSDKEGAAFQYSIEGGDGVMLTSHHVKLDVWAPQVMEGRSEKSSISTVHKGKQEGTLAYEMPHDSVTASLKSLRKDSDISPEGNFEVRERTKYQIAKDTVIRKLQNKFRELMVLQEDVEAYRGKLDESQDFRLKETLFYGKAANDLELLEQKVSRLKQVMKDNGIKSEELGEYMYALHAQERNALIKERDGVENGSGMSDAEAQQILDRITPERKAELEKGAAVLREIMQGTRDTLRDFGLNTKEEVDGFESQFQNYIPLAGIAKDEQIDGSAYPTGGAGLAVYKSPVKKAKGRKYKAQEVVAQVIAQSANTSIHARKNEALEALYNMVVNNPNPAVWQVTGVAEYGDKSVVPVRVAGKKKYIKFTNTHYADSLNGMTVEKTNTFIKILRAPSNWLRRSFTTLDPEFVISNFARDIQSAIFNATADAELDGNGMNGADVRSRITRSVFPLMKSLLKDAAGKDMSPEHRVFYEEFKADGGKTGWAYAKPLEDIAADLQEKPDTAAQKVLGSINKVTDFIEGVNDAVENSIRLASYIAARENGVSREKAAVFAKNITVNFNKSGEMGQVANAVYLFFNASVQGTARIAKSLTLKPKFKDNGQQRSWQERITGAQKLAMSLTLLNAMLAAVNEAFSDDDEDGKSFYSKISDYEKERNMIIMVGGKNYIKIPMPYGYNVFANMGTAVSEVAMGNREIDDALMFLLSSAFGSFSPISFGQSKDVYGMLEKGLAPTVAKPFIEVANNETFFGSQVYAKQFPGATKKPDSQMSFRAPKYLRDLFEFMNEVSGGSEFKSGWFDKNPDKAWYLFEYFLGGAGRFVTRTGEIVQKAGNKAFVDGEVDLEFNDAPILRKMYGEASRYYDYDLFEKNSEELGQLHKEMKNLGFDASKHQSVHMLNENLKRAKKQLKILRERRREARQIEGYAERTIRLQELMEKERQIMMNFNKLYEERRK